MERVAVSTSVGALMVCLGVSCLSPVVAFVPPARAVAPVSRVHPWVDPGNLLACGGPRLCLQSLQHIARSSSVLEVRAAPRETFKRLQMNNERGLFANNRAALVALGLLGAILLPQDAVAHTSLYEHLGVVDVAVADDKRVLYTAIYSAGHSLIAIPFLFFWKVDAETKAKGAVVALPILTAWIALLGGWIPIGQ